MKPVQQDRVAKPSRSEAKADATTRTVRSIIESERASFETKTQRLRKARLAKEAEEQKADAAAPAGLRGGRRSRAKPPGQPGGTAS